MILAVADSPAGGAELARPGGLDDFATSFKLPAIWCLPARLTHKAERGG